MHRRKPKLIYRNHSTLLVPNEAATRCSNRLLEADRSDHARFCRTKCCEQFRGKRFQVSEPVRFGPQQNHRYSELWQMLLKRQVTVNSNEDVEFNCGQGQQPAV